MFWHRAYQIGGIKELTAYWMSAHDISMAYNVTEEQALRALMFLMKENILNMKIEMRDHGRSYERFFKKR